MNFSFTWIMDKLGYMPKIDLEIGKVKLDPKEVWPFPSEKKTARKKPTVQKATTRKTKKA